MTTHTTIETIEVAIKAGYKELQKAMKDLRESGAIAPTTKLKGTKQELEARGRAIVQDLMPIAQTEGTIATNAAAFNKIVRQLPSGTIVNNSEFGDRILSGTAFEKSWLIAKDGADSTIVLQRRGDFYITYAGDAIRLAIACDMVVTTQKGVATCGLPAYSIERYKTITHSKGIALHLI